MKGCMTHACLVGINNASMLHAVWQISLVTASEQGKKEKKKTVSQCCSALHSADANPAPADSDAMPGQRKKEEVRVPRPLAKDTWAATHEEAHAQPDAATTHLTSIPIVSLQHNCLLDTVYGPSNAYCTAAF